MALNFPANPEANDTYTSNGTTWEFDGVVWNVQPSERNIFTTFDADTGSVTPDTANDTLIVAGGTGVSTSLTGKTLTITSTVEGGTTQNLFETVASDDGSSTASTATATLSVLGGTNIDTEITTDTNNLTINMAAFGIDFLSDVDTDSVTPATGNVLKWNGSNWAPGTDATTGGAGTDADTLDGFDGSYYLDWANVANKPSVVTLTDLSVGNELTAASDGAISYDNTTGVFRYTPPDLSGYLTSFTETNDLSTAVTWANVPNANITESSVTQHQAALSVTESQISDLGTYLTSINAISIDALSDVDTTTSAPSDGQILAWDNDASKWAPSAAGSGGDVNQNAFTTISVLGSSDIIADSTTDTLNFVNGNGIVLSTTPGTDTITIASNVVAGASQFSQLTDAQSAGISIDEVAENAMVTLRVGANGFTSYTFNSHYTGSNPTIYAISGTTIAFDLNAAPGHPTEIQDATGTALTSGVFHVTPQGALTQQTVDALHDPDRGTLYWRIPENTSGNFRYQCTAHAPMVGVINIKRLSTL